MESELKGISLGLGKTKRKFGLNKRIAKRGRGKFSKKSIPAKYIRNVMID